MLTEEFFVKLITLIEKENISVFNIIYNNFCSPSTFRFLRVLRNSMNHHVVCRQPKKFNKIDLNGYLFLKKSHHFKLTSDICPANFCVYISIFIADIVEVREVKQTKELLFKFK